MQPASGGRTSQHTNERLSGAMPLFVIGWREVFVPLAVVLHNQHGPTLAVAGLAIAASRTGQLAARQGIVQATTLRSGAAGRHRALAAGSGARGRAGRPAALVCLRRDLADPAGSVGGARLAGLGRRGHSADRNGRSRAVGQRPGNLADRRVLFLAGLAHRPDPSGKRPA